MYNTKMSTTVNRLMIDFGTLFPTLRTTQVCLENHNFNPYQSQIECQLLDLGSDEVLAIGSCKRIQFKNGSNNNHWIAWWIASGPSDRTKESYSKLATSLCWEICPKKSIVKLLTVEQPSIVTDLLINKIYLASSS